VWEDVQCNCMSENSLQKWALLKAVINRRMSWLQETSWEGLLYEDTEDMTLIDNGQVSHRAQRPVSTIIHTYIHTQTYIHTHTHKNTHIHSYIHTYTQTHVHTYIHTHMHTYTHIHTYTHTHTYIDTHTYIHTTYTRIHTYPHTYIYIYIHTHTYIHTHIHTYTHTQTYIHTHTYIHKCTYHHPTLLNLTLSGKNVNYAYPHATPCGLAATVGN